MKKRLLVLTVLICAAFALCGCGKEKKEENLLSGKVYAEIKVKDRGVIKLELDADVAPITVTNFVNLANDKFYDGLTFHRVVKNFMIQGGDPNGNGSGGSENPIKGEFENNGVKNSISHLRGVISMARRQEDMDSASSQFFIVHKDSTSLDGDYAAFGHVTDGMDIVDDIAENVPSENPVTGLVAKDKQPVIESITISTPQLAEDNEDDK